jgi:hypothetical protein
MQLNMIQADMKVNAIPSRRVVPALKKGITCDQELSGDIKSCATCCGG